MKASLKVLKEAAEVQSKKSEDYQNAVSTVEQADYYVNGVQTIYDTMHGKLLRIKSVMETQKAGGKENFESLKDSCIDLINYTSFFAAYLEHGIPGQDPNRDIFNRKISPNSGEIADEGDQSE